MWANSLACIAILFACGCHETKGKEPAMIPIQPTQPVNMVEGPAIHPAGPLRDWLDKNAQTAAGRRQLFRLPVVIRFDDQHRLGISGAYVGVSEQDIGEDALALKLDDSGMGVDLLSQVRER